MSNYLSCFFICLLFVSSKVQCQEGLAVEEVEKVDPGSLLELDGLKLSPKTESFRLNAKVQSEVVGFNLTITWIAANPEGAVLILMDGKEGTPIAASFAGRTVFYDPIKGAIISMEGSGYTSTIGLEGESLNFQFTTPSDKAQIEIDLASILERASVDRKLEKIADSAAIVWSGKSAKGNQCKAVFDPRAKLPVQQIDLSGKDDPDHSLLSIRLSEYPDPPELLFSEFPIESLKELDVAFEETDLKDIANSAKLVNRIIVGKLALSNPDYRKPFGAVDWEQAQKRDKEISAELRKIFSKHIEHLSFRE